MPNGLDFGIGTDIEPTHRFERERKDPLLKRIFTSKEMAYCFGKRYPKLHLAARYVGKEAVYKALCALEKRRLGISLKEIELTTGKNGMPGVKIYNVLSRKVNVEVSLAHCDNNAVAFAIATRKKK